MPQELSPAVVRFQKIKAENKQKAIVRAKLREEIRSANPVATPKQVEQIIDAHLRTQQARTIKVPSVQGKVRTVKVFQA